MLIDIIAVLVSSYDMKEGSGFSITSPQEEGLGEMYFGKL